MRRDPSRAAMLASILLAGCGSGSAPPAPVAAREFDDPGFVASGQYEMRYGMVLASELPVEVASAYGIDRRPDRVVVNVSVLRRQQGALPLPVEANVEGTWRTLVGERQPLAFRAVLEAKTISYIAEAPARDHEPTTFEMRAEPPRGAAIVVRITREFDTRSR